MVVCTWLLANFNMDISFLSTYVLVLVSYDCHHKVPWIWWLKIMETWSLTGPEYGNPKSRYQLGEVSFLALPLLAPDNSWLWQRSSSLCVHLHMAFCYDLDLECPPGAHVLKARSPVQQWSEAGLLGSDSIRGSDPSSGLVCWWVG